jgi:hypothetical protein
MLSKSKEETAVLSCRACGFITELDPSHPLYNQILKEVKLDLKTKAQSKKSSLNNTFTVRASLFDLEKELDSINANDNKVGSKNEEEEEEESLPDEFGDCDGLGE